MGQFQFYFHCLEVLHEYMMLEEIKYHTIKHRYFINSYTIRWRWKFQSRGSRDKIMCIDEKTHFSSSDLYLQGFVACSDHT